MTDYIKREDAIRSIADHDEFKGERWIKEAWADYMIEDAKPADVAPVRHGRWIDTDMYGFPVVECSECGAQTGTLNFPYCFNCGARMDKEVD